VKSVFADQVSKVGVKCTKRGKNKSQNVNSIVTLLSTEEFAS